MLQEGKIVRIGNDDYKVTRVPTKRCCKCDLKRCSENEDFENLKRKMGAKTCSDIIDLQLCFKKLPKEVELAPQVVYK